MKILVLSTCYPKKSRPNHGIFIHRQIRALKDLGVECHVLQPINWAPVAPLHRFHPDWERSYREMKDRFFDVEGIPVHHPKVFLPKPSRCFPGDYWERVGHAVYRYINKRRDLKSSDLLYAPFLCHEGYAGLVASRRLNMPLVAIARGDDVHAWPKRWPDRIGKIESVITGATGLLANSKGLAADALKWSPNGLKRSFEVIYNGIDINRFFPHENLEQKHKIRKNFALPERKKLLLSVATPIKAKGWIELLDAFSLHGYDNKQWDLVMVGAPRGNDDLDLIKEAEIRNIAERVHWLGCLPPERMPDLYRAVDAFVLASHNEGLSNSMLEAMASGLPVVVTAVGGHSEIINNRINGLMVTPRNTNLLRDALADVMFDAPFAQKVGDEARKTAIRIGDSLKNAEKLLHYFKGLKQA